MLQRELLLHALAVHDTQTLAGTATSATATHSATRLLHAG